MSVRRSLGALAGVTAAAAVIANYQPDGGTWQNGPLLVGLIAALWLDRASGVLALAGSIAAVGSLAVADGRRGAVLSIVFTAVPWYLVLRLMRELAAQRNALRESRAAEAGAAAVAERARLAREMHDVLAHSLSALALQLESTRLLARDRGADRRGHPRRSTAPISSRPAGSRRPAARSPPPAATSCPGPDRHRRPRRRLRRAERAAGAGRGARRAARAGAGRPAGGVPHRPGGADQRPPSCRPRSASR